MAGEKMTPEEITLHNALFEVEDRERVFGLRSGGVLPKFREQLLTGLGLSLVGGLALGGFVGLLVGRRGS